MEMFLTQVKSMKTELRKKILMRMALMSQNCIKLYQAIANHITVTPTFENKIKKKTQNMYYACKTREITSPLLTLAGSEGWIPNHNHIQSSKTHS